MTERFANGNLDLAHPPGICSCAMCLVMSQNFSHVKFICALYLFAGATSGIGKETARVLAKRGAHIIMAIRNTKTGEEVKTAISDETPNARVDIIQLDLASLASVRNFAEEFKSRKLPLNVLMWVFSPVLSHFGYINLLWIDISSLVVLLWKCKCEVYMKVHWEIWYFLTKWGVLRAHWVWGLWKSDVYCEASPQCSHVSLFTHSLTLFCLYQLVVVDDSSLFVLLQEYKSKIYTKVHCEIWDLWCKPRLGMYRSNRRVLHWLTLGVGRNNAGYMSGKFMLSEDKLEKVFATNHIGQYYYEHLLSPYCFGLHFIKSFLCQWCHSNFLP